VSLVLVANVAALSLPFDDSYVSIAYAAHLITGHGLRLSIGSPPTEAFSDPLWVALTATGKAVGLTITTWARLVNVTLIALLAATTAGIARRLNPKATAWMAALAAALVAFHPYRHRAGWARHLPARAAICACPAERCASSIVGALAHVMTEAGGGPQCFTDIIRHLLVDAPAVNFDETGARVAGSLHWVDVACSR
jgi:hypothetical protein